jgi:hypothetical protein
VEKSIQVAKKWTQFIASQGRVSIIVNPIASFCFVCGHYLMVACRNLRPIRGSAVGGGEGE